MTKVTTSIINNVNAMKNTDITQKTQTCCNFVHVCVILQISLTHNKLK